MRIPSYRDWKFMRVGGMTDEEITKLYLMDLEHNEPKKETWNDVEARLKADGIWGYGSGEDNA